MTIEKFGPGQQGVNWQRGVVSKKETDAEVKGLEKKAKTDKTAGLIIGKARKTPLKAYKTSKPIPPIPEDQKPREKVHQELKQGIERWQLKKMQTFLRQQERQVPEDQKYDMLSLDVSVNPVAKVEYEEYIPFELVEDKAIEAVRRDATKTPEQKERRIQDLKRVFILAKTEFPFSYRLDDLVSSVQSTTMFPAVRDSAMAALKELRRKGIEILSEQELTKLGIPYAIVKRIKNNPLVSKSDLQQFKYDETTKECLQSITEAFNIAQDKWTGGAEKLEAAVKSDPPNDKAGEIVRELLAQTLFKHTSTEHFVMKLNLKLDKSTIAGGNLENAVGSIWIQDSKPFPLKKFMDYSKAELKASQTKSKGNLKAVENAKNAFFKAMGLANSEQQRKFLESSQEHALTDMIYLSTDSHCKQYLIKSDGEAIGFDYARFLPVSSVFQSDHLHYAGFRSAFFDLPSSRDAIAEPLANKILAWDPAKIGKNIEKAELVGGEDYVSAKKEVENALNDIRNLYNRIKNVKGKGNSPSHAMLKKEIEEKQDAIAKLLPGLRKKIDPSAFEEFKKRLSVIKDLVQSRKEAGQPNPSIREIFAVAYPDLAPFMEVLERMDPAPSEKLGRNNNSFYRSLEDVVAEAAAKRKISKEEKVQLMKLLKKWDTAPDLSMTNITWSPRTVL
jgi:hypothetical protein